MTTTREALRCMIPIVVLHFLAIVAVSSRFTARLRGSSLKSDDWTILLALICASCLVGSEIWAATNGVKGVRFEFMTLETWATFRKIQLSGIIISHFIYGCIKISVVLFYKRIFWVSQRFNLVANIVLALISLWIIFAIFMVVFCVRGVTAWWTTPPQLDGTQYRFKLATVLLGLSIINIVLDVVILSLPQPIIKNMNLTLRKKLSVTGIFLLGGFCLVSSIIRLYYTVTLAAYFGQDGHKRLVLADNNDLWAYIEANASIITACLPTLGSLARNAHPFGSFFTGVQQYFSSLFTRSSSESGSKTAPSHDPYVESPPKKEKGAWYELTTRLSPQSEVTNLRSRDVETGSQRSDAIMVKQTISSRSD